MKKTFYSNGKLLITGEYVVLEGATALALPTKFGQYLHVSEGPEHTIHWTSYDIDGSVWFTDSIHFEEVKQKMTFGKDAGVKNTLIEILHHAYRANPSFLENTKGYTVTTALTFPKAWGLGTSSTLINNIAQWLTIDAFELLRNSFGGSGYDIACAQNNTPILYHLESGKPIIHTLDFNPIFKENLYFVYLNKKQNSKAAIASYYEKQQRLDKTIAKISQLTSNAIQAQSLGEFAGILENHEAIMSDILEMQTVKEAFFNDFNGVVKSLGAWGGDFVLAISKDDPTDYFKALGYLTVLPYSEMIK
ncbi:GYDIA family GHMP kinase [Flavobacterium enshiense]|uniref:GYDIA family GHMP kinase n=1 Tax=Flavobacterium enshiense TaxID=1341165 RepID=UPI00345CD0B6